MTEVVAAPTMFVSAVLYMENGVVPVVREIRHVDESLRVSDLRAEISDHGVSGLNLAEGSSIIVDGAISQDDNELLTSLTKKEDGSWDIRREAPGSTISFVTGGKKGGK